jgi:hypothetical protein
MLRSCASETKPVPQATPFKAPLPHREKHTPRTPAMFTTSDHGDTDSDLEPADSASRSGRAPGSASRSKPNPFSKYSGLENSLLRGLAEAFPKEREAIAPSRQAEQNWYYMRGFALRPNQVVKADLIQKKWCSDAAGAFRPATLPPELPLSCAVKGANAYKAAKQRTYAAPAHVLATLIAGLDPEVTIPLREAMLATQDPHARQRMEGALDFIQGRMAVLLGTALRSLASSFNHWHNQRREAVVCGQSADVQAALNPFTVGFRNFFSSDIRPSLTTAASTAQLRFLTESTHKAQHAQQNRQQSNQTGGNATNNSNSNSNAQRGRGGNNRGGRNRRRGSNRGRGGQSNNASRNTGGNSDSTRKDNQQKKKE